MASTSSADNSSSKMTLQELIRFLTTKGLSLSDSMKAAGPLVKARYTSQSELKHLNESKLAAMGIKDPDVRKLLSNLGGSKPKSKITDIGKRKRDQDLDRPLPKGQPVDPELMSESTISFDFHEELDEELLTGRSVVINRAPIMTAWSTVVAERLGFKRRESLSLAQAFTDLNAKTKGVSIGIFPESSLKNQGGGPSQPYVDLMGRKIPVLSLKDGEWRAVTGGEMIKPSVAFGYLQRSFKQQLGSVIGSMKLLAESFPVNELGTKGMGLYYEFRPQNTNWGERSDVKLESILNLRRFITHKEIQLPREEKDQQERSDNTKLPENAYKVNPPAMPENENADADSDQDQPREKKIKIDKGEKQ